MNHPNKDYRFVGLANGNECHCGNTSERVISAPFQHCDMPCSGDRNSICGSSWRMNFYEIAQYSLSPRNKNSPVNSGKFKFFSALGESF